MMPTGGGDLTTVRLPRLLKCTVVYLGWYLAYLRILYQVPPRTKLNHEVGGAIHTSEVAVNGRSASPWAWHVQAAPGQLEYDVVEGW